MTTPLTIFLEIFLFISIICVTILVQKLKSTKDNFNSLKKELLDLQESSNSDKDTRQDRESKLHQTIEGLREVLSEEQQSVKIKIKAAKDLEEDLLKQIAEIEKKLEDESEARKKIVSQKKSSEVRLGHIAEKLAPFLDDFPYEPENATFLGQPIDYIVFEDDEIVFIEIKSGNSKLSQKQRNIRDLVKNKCVSWKEIRIKD